MKKHFLLLTLFISQFASAQNVTKGCYTIRWALDMYHVYVKDMAIGYDGNYITAGIISDYGPYGYVMKSDPSGNLVWFKYIQSFTNLTPNSIIETSDHNIVTTGYYGGKIFIAKYSEDGALLWAEDISVFTIQTAYDVIETSDGGYLLAGYDQISYYTIIIKMNTDGTVAWNRNYLPNMFGGVIYSLTETSNHRYVGAGIELLHNQKIVWSMDESGSIQWAKVATSYGESFAVVPLADNGMVVSGMNTVTDNAEVSKLDVNGNVVWSQDYGAGTNDIFYAAAATPDGGFIFSGSNVISPDTTYAMIAHIDAGGQLLWMKGFADRGLLAMHVADDGGYVAAGGFAPNSHVNAFFIKLDEAGNTCLNCGGSSYGTQSAGTTYSDIAVAELSQAAVTTDLTVIDASGGEEYPICLETGINESGNQKAGFTIFPNPADDRFTIHNFSADNSSTELFMTDLAGRMVMKILPNEFHSGETDVNISSLPSSTYFLIEETSENIQMQKFVVQH